VLGHADAGIRGLGPKRVPGSIRSIRMLNDCDAAASDVGDVCCDGHPCGCSVQTLNSSRVHQGHVSFWYDSLLLD
jgi:hypothetical protein